MFIVIVAGWLLVAALATAAYCRIARARRCTSAKSEAWTPCEVARGETGRCTMLRANRCRALT